MYVRTVKPLVVPDVVLWMFGYYRIGIPTVQ